ncbi:MAG TPA: photosystem II cytochrome PsbV2 [Kamptonema sp.]|nr:photosystem II cytochrome PsbV2 [Kamptonema sp.]
MLRRSVLFRYLLGILVTGCLLLSAAQPVLAGAVDPYVVRYLQAKEPVELELDGHGTTRLFSVEDLSAGKRLFENNCLNCHVGGATLPNPMISLSLTDLKGAIPARDNISSLVAFLREPQSYDGSEESYWCRQVPESWMPQKEVENLAAFVLRAAQKAPGWGVDTFEN